MLFIHKERVADNNPKCTNTLTMHKKLHRPMLHVALFSIQLPTLKLGNSLPKTYVVWLYPLCSNKSVSMRRKSH